MNLLVSVVLPIYNVEQYLEQCIKSVVNQTYKNLEIILVDDGSPDNCPKICDDWAQKDSRIKVVHKQNAGLGMARNTGIDNASGKYIFFFDSDDYVDTTIVEKCVISAQKHQSEVVVFGRYDVYENGEIKPCILKNDKSAYKHDEIVNTILPCVFTYELGFGVSAWGKMYDLDMLRKNNLRFVSEREIISEDAYFSLSLFSKTTVLSVVNENLYYYRKRQNSLSRTYKKDRQSKNDSFLNKCIKFIENENLPQHICNHIKARYHGMTLGTLMQIARCELTNKEKRTELYSIYHNKVLKQTLSKEVLTLDYKFPRLFWITLKLRLYPLCTLLLNFNKHK